MPAEEIITEETSTIEDVVEEQASGKEVEIEGVVEEQASGKEVEIEDVCVEEKQDENVVEKAEISESKNKIVKKDSHGKGRTYNGKYEIYPNGDGYQYRLKASNGEILIVSETYASRDGVIKAIDAVKRNIESGEIRIIEDKHGKFKFKLTSKNYRVVAFGANYSTEKSAVRASESFKKFAMKADIVDITLSDDSDLNSSVVVIGERVDKIGGKFVVEKYNGEFSWDLKATNGQILCQAEGYMSKVGVMNSIENFKKNVEKGSFKIIKDKNDHFHYNLYTPTGRVAAIGETYASKQQAESAVNSVVAFYKKAEIVEKNNI